jgi:hypothetical protein
MAAVSWARVGLNQRSGRSAARFCWCPSRGSTGLPGTAASPPEFGERYSGAIGPVKIVLVCTGAWTLSPR